MEMYISKILYNPSAPPFFLSFFKHIQLQNKALEPDNNDCSLSLITKWKYDGYQDSNENRHISP